MAFGSARSFAPVSVLAAFCAAFVLSAPVRAAEADEALCQAPMADIASPAPLPHLAKLLQSKRKVRVLAIGSSSTVGIGASSIRTNYTSRLETELGKAFTDLKFVMYNRGVSGEVAETTAERIKLEVALTRPDIVLWQVGTNDALSRVPISDFAQTVARTLKWLKAADIDVVLVGLQYTKSLSGDAHYKLMKDALRQVAAQENVPLIKRYEAMQHIEQTNAKLSLVGDDRLHLNDLGYRCMAEHVARGILVSLFPKGAKPAPVTQ